MFVIGIAGGSGSGKTTLAEYLVKLGAVRGVSYIQTDWYYRAQDDVPFETREKVNYDHPDAIETELLAHHVCELVKGEVAECPLYDFSQHNRSHNKKIIYPADILIVEGILALHYPALLPLYDFKVFVDAPDELRLKRRLARDVTERGRTPESVQTQWDKTVCPMHHKFCQPSKEHADLVIPDGFVSEAIAEEILTKVR